MKKQILFLTFFVLAAFAGMNKSYGQEVDYLVLPTGDVVPSYCVPAVPLTCGDANDALAPMPGVPYDYTITSSSIGTIHWFVTDDADIITTEGAIAAAIENSDGTSPYILSAGTTYDVATNISPTVNITWKSFDGVNNAVLLVAYAVNEEDCTDNIEVFRIVPDYSFTLDIAGILDGGTEGATECVAPVQTASFDGVTNTLTVDYGVNYVFFTVNAANWQTSWETSLAASTSGSSVLGDPEWAYPADATTTGAWNASGTPVLASEYTSNDNGFIASECIIVRVPVTHTATENIVDETISLVVNGQMVNPADGTYGAYPDLENVDADTDGKCDSDLITDTADYLITPRPDVNESTPSPFETKTF